ncbi:hypothetical protein [Helicobacter salomonis]|uniref:hypothetical protein n=1 Tax=Helicobacter salomonis TaxID=56878 RepID=UPI000CF0D232|nr:hypothetical protein [Helicobacter salomonis]
MPRRTTLVLVGALILGACTSTPNKQVFLQNMPMWMVQDRSMYVTQGIDSSHVINGQVERSEGIARERARFRVAIHIANKIRDIYIATQNAKQKPYDDEIFKEITQAIATSLDKEVQLGEYINPNNHEVFMLVGVKSYSAERLEKGLLEVSALDMETIKQIKLGVKKIFDEVALESDAQTHNDFSKEGGGH